MELKEIEKLAQGFSTAHANLTMLVSALEQELQQAKRARLAEIRKAVATARERKAAVLAAVEAEPALWEKPRTRILHGIKVGLRKQKGGLEWDDPDKVVERIERIYQETAADYLHIEKKPDKAALDKLTVCELRKLGVEVKTDSDKPVCDPADGDVDKIVAALLKDNPEGV